MGFLVTYLSFCQHIQIVILKLQTEWCHSVTIVTCCLRSGFDFSIVYLRIRTMHLEKLHIFGRHNTSCLWFSQEYAIEGHSHCLNHYLGVREDPDPRFFSNLSVIDWAKKWVRVYEEQLLPLLPLLRVVRIGTFVSEC